MTFPLAHFWIATLSFPLAHLYFATLSSAGPLFAGNPSPAPLPVLGMNENKTGIISLSIFWPYHLRGCMKIKREYFPCPLFLFYHCIIRWDYTIEGKACQGKEKIFSGMDFVARHFIYFVA